jgi:CubicO group peptidase (beta-lactamase class C family)
MKIPDMYLKLLLLLHCILAGGIISTVNSQTYYPPSDLNGGWRMLHDPREIKEKAGIDVTRLDAAFEYLKEDTKNGGLLVLRDGWLVYEKYFGKGHREAIPNLGSTAKSFTSIAVGILMSQYPELFPEGLEQKVFTPQYFPEWVFPLSDPRMYEIKLGQLLSFTAGIRGNNPVYIHGAAETIDPVGPDGWYALVDELAFGKEEGKMRDTPFSTKTLWCEPGNGYSYASASAHIASIMVRHISGMELEDYLNKHLGKELGWGRWGYGYKYAELVTHTPGGGGIAVRSTDMLRYGYMLLNEGRWQSRQIVPASYVRQCSRTSPYNPHFPPYSLLFLVNTDGYYWPDLGADIYWTGGSGRHCLYIVPSLNLVVYKLGGRDGQYSEADTGIPIHPEALKAEESREDWKDAGYAFDDGIIKTLELVIKSVLR